MHFMNVSAWYGHSGTGKTWEEEILLPVTDPQMGQSELRVQARFNLLGTNRSLVVMGSFITECQVICDRCARPFNLKLSGDFEEEFLKEADWSETDFLSGSFKDFPFAVDEYQQINLVPLIHQSVFLALAPVNHCHRSDCQIPLIKNEAGVKTDARWEKLKFIKEQLERE